MKLSRLEEFDRMRPQLFVPPGHYYSPIGDRNEVELHISNLELKALPQNVPDIEIDREEMIREWNELVPFLMDITFQEELNTGLRYCFENPNYSWGNGIYSYTIIRRYGPKKIMRDGPRLVIMLHDRHNRTVLRILPSNIRRTISAALEKPIRKPLAEIEIIDTPVQRVPIALFESLAQATYCSSIPLTSYARAAMFVLSYLRYSRVLRGECWFTSMTFSGHLNIREFGLLTKTGHGMKFMLSGPFFLTMIIGKLPSLTITLQNLRQSLVKHLPKLPEK